MFLQITIVEAMMKLQDMTTDTQTQLFNTFTQLRKGLNADTLTVASLRALGLDISPFYDEIDTFHEGYLEHLIHQFSLQRKVDMNEHHYDKSVLQKLWLLFMPLVDFFSQLEPKWTLYYLSQDKYKEKIEALFSHDLAEFILISRYIELSQSQKLIHSSEDSDELSAQLHQALYDLLGVWSRQGGALTDYFKPTFIALLKTKENLD